MLSAATARAIGEALIDTERAAEQAGWDAPPQLLAMFIRPGTTIEIAPVPLHPATWRDSNPAQTGPYIPATAILDALTAYFTATRTPDWLRTWLRDEGRTPVGFAFLCEGWSSPRTAGYRHGGIRLFPYYEDDMVRSLSAFDTDGRYYHVLRRRGADTASASTDDDPAPLIRQTMLGSCLYRLRHLALPA
ncbi:hypothetical protein JNW91_00635 [Micromonospora sp. STR1_7]|uniref:GNAT family N-acetyltransferase n=1 Tax=Micromonospora parastrephiae TaxID=2806101 RepID=A0ABS1XMN1_9ACTN|nr:hypothetical protein [Micromonospora parastrephiae]MBM0230508.1 hypothetical protein [Micromonospora parastrephiae]